MAARKPARSASKAPQVAPPGRHTVKPAPPPVGPSPRALAVGAFERGFQALQQRQFDRAARLLKHVIDGYPDEKELQERARVYLNVCERQGNSKVQAPKSLEERINTATVAINDGAFKEGLGLLRELESDHRDNDHIQYMLAVAYTVLGDPGQALGHLRQAIALNQENRYLATQDADLELLRQGPGFVAALDTPPAPKTSAAGSGARLASKKR